MNDDFGTTAPQGRKVRAGQFGAGRGGNSMTRQEQKAVKELSEMISKNLKAVAREHGFKVVSDYAYKVLGDFLYEVFYCQNMNFLPDKHKPAVLGNILSGQWTDAGHW